MPPIGEAKAHEKATKQAEELRLIGPETLALNLSQWAKFKSRESKPSSRGLREEILARSGKPAPSSWCNDQLYQWLRLNPRLEVPIGTAATEEEQADAEKEAEPAMQGGVEEAPSVESSP